MGVVKLHNVYKSYKEVKALKEISFEVNKGELFGLIGPDGAGKTTMFRLLTTLLLADQGEIEVLGLDAVKDFKEIRTKIGYMPGTFSLYTDLSIDENLHVFASLFNTTVAENLPLIDAIYQQLAPFKDRRAGNLSGGMKQKLALCCALIHRPELLLLDEPTTGVDPTSRKEFWDILKTLEKEGITIIVSTPYMDEASLCDRIALMQKGDILELDSPQGIVANFKEKIYAAKADQMYPLLLELQKLKNIVSVFPFGETHHITVAENVEFPLDQVLESLKKTSLTGVSISLIPASIEDCFMYLSNQNEHGE